jgi:hypothetical protein
MRGPVAFVKSCATLRGLGAAIGLAVVLALVVQFVVIPPYREITGFIPFDAQPRLSHVMVGIELGAVAKGTAAGAYVVFALVDALSAAATAWAFTLGWVLLFALAPNRIFAFLTRGGIMMIPLYVLALDLVAKVGFFRLVSGLDGPDYSAAIDFSVLTHRLELAMTDLRNYLTAGFLLMAMTGMVLRLIRR